MKRGYWIGKMVVLGVLAIVAFTFVTMYLWNWLVPELFHGPQINFWQTMGLFVLSKILFSGFGKGGHSHNGKWRGYWKDKWQAMTPEEKEKFKARMKDKWCYQPKVDKEGVANG
ncbi:MAG: hypothetical protein ACKVOQ_14950 [Cyclobacteriaceae bacterium]